MKELIAIILFFSLLNLAFTQPKKSADSLNLEANATESEAYKLLTEMKLEESKSNMRIPYWDSLAIRADKINAKRVLANSLNNLGYIYKNKGLLIKAIDYYYRSLKIREENLLPNGQPVDKHGIAVSLNNIGRIYNDQGDNDMALEFLEASLKAHEEIKNYWGVARSLNNIGAIYDDKADLKMALSYYRRSLKLRETEGDTKRIPESLNSIGGILCELDSFELGFSYLNRALKMFKEMKNEQWTAFTYNKLCLWQFRSGAISKALYSGQKALDIAVNEKLPVNIERAALTLSEIKTERGEYKDALTMYKLHIKLRDSLKNEQIQRSTIKQGVKYEYEKKAIADSIKTHEQQKVLDAQIFAQEAQLSQEKTFKYSLFGGLGLVALFSLFVMNRLKATRVQKVEIEQKNNILNDRNTEIAQQKDLVEQRNKEVLDSIIYAERIQSAILPPRRLVKQCLPNSFILYKPKDIVAGDFYWLEEQGDEIYFSAADCTGHGVPGAMMSVMCSTALTKCVQELSLRQPGEILDATTKIIEGIFERSGQLVLDGMDLALCKLNLKTKTLTYSGANNPLWVVRNRIMESQTEQAERILYETKADKQPIGQFDNRKPYTNHVIHLQKGDSFYIFSDGFVDQFGGAKGKKYKSSSFKELILSIQNENMERQMALLNEAFENWKGELDQVDDVCIIGVSI